MVEEAVVVMNSKLTRTLLVLVLIVLGGCARPVAEPARPTDCDQDCVENCLTERDCCVKACNWVVERDQPDCRDDCTEELQGCYEECEQAE